MKTLLITATALGSVMTLAQTAQAGDVSISVSADYVSEYVFRGVSFANTAIQPGISISKGGFTVGTWVSTGLGQSSANASDEIDIYGSYGWNISPNLSATVGATIYHFPQTPGGLFDFGNGDASSFEGYFSLSHNGTLSPSVTAFYDFALEAFTLSGSVSHSQSIADKTSLNLGLTGGFVTSDNSTDYEWATASASLNYSVTNNSSLYVGANFSLNSEDFLDFPTANDITPNDNLLWFGTGIFTTF